MNKKWIIIAVVSILVIGAAALFYASNNKSDESSTQPAPVAAEPEEPVDEVPERTIVYQATGILNDVSGGSADGEALAIYYEDGAYELKADLSGLDQLTNGDFYEGWLVNQEKSEFFSTGVVAIDSVGAGVDSYTSDVDHQTQGYDFYVLTLEPDDGDPAPAKHILEGLLEITE